MLKTQSSFGTTKKSNKNRNVAICGNNLKEIKDLYFNVKDENARLKNEIKEQDNEIKKMRIKLSKMPKQQPNNQQKKEEQKSNVLLANDNDVNTLKFELQNLRNKNSKMKTIIAGLQKDLKSRSYINSFYKPKNLSSPKNSTFYGTAEVNDYLKLISHLQQSLKDAHNDRKKLIDDLANIKENGSSKLIIEYSDDIRDKNLKLSEMGLQISKLKSSFETNQQILNLTKNSLEEYMEKYKIERNKNTDLENQLQMQESALAKLNEYSKMIEEYKKKEKSMEQRIMDLCENPFIKQANERDNAFAQLRATQMALNESEKRLKNFMDENSELKNKLKELNNNYNKVLKERDQFKEEGLRYKIDKEEREKMGKEFDEVFNKISKFGEVDSNYENIINLLKGQINDPTGKKWENIDFLEKMDDFPDDKEKLVKEIQRLKIEKGILGEELEKSKILLTKQIGLNEDYKNLKEVESKKYNAQIKILQQKILRLVDLIENKNIPVDNDIKKIINEHRQQSIIGNDKKYEKNILEDNSDKNSVYTSITGFSIDSEENNEFAVDENSLDLYITTANFDKNSIENKLGIPLDNLMSFITVDFYLHETQTSNLMTGQNPNYNFQLMFKVNVDEHFILYLQDDVINIEVYYLQNNTQIIFARGIINLNQLINVEKDPKSRVVHGYCEIYYANDSSIKIGDIKYKMRMRKSINNILKWIKDKNELFKELDPVNQANYKMMSELNMKHNLINELEFYGKENINNKIYNIKIMITKGEELKVYGPPRRINPYIYYQFFKQNEHYSNIMTGSDPLFDDMAQYTCVYNANFHEYLDKELLNIYIFDSSRPIQVDTEGKEVELLREENNNDLIGICKIKLKGLIFNNKIEGKFAILSEDGLANMGYLVVNITAEEILFDDKSDVNINIYPKEVIEGIDPLLIKLAALLRSKCLNMNSAFHLFDLSNSGHISLVDFKSTIFLTLKFTKKDEEIQKLIDIIFGKKVILDKQDFYQVFNNLLPFEDDVNANRMTVAVLDKGVGFEIKGQPKKNMQYSINNVSVSQSLNMGQGQGMGSIANSGKLNINQPSIINESVRSREMSEIMIIVENYMINFGKTTAADLYKIFDYDANLSVGRKELAEGFGRMGISLTSDELEMIWKAIVGKQDKEKFEFVEFREFFEKNKINNKNRANVSIAK